MEIKMTYYTEPRLTEYIARQVSALFVATLTLLSIPLLIIAGIYFMMALIQAGASDISRDGIFGGLSYSFTFVGLMILFNIIAYMVYATTKAGGLGGAFAGASQGIMYFAYMIFCAASWGIVAFGGLTFIIMAVVNPFVMVPVFLILVGSVAMFFLPDFFEAF